MSIISETATAAGLGDKQGLKEVLDFLVTEEQLGVTFVTAAIERAPGTPSEAFVPVLRNAVTQEFHHVEALKEAGGTQLTTSYWFPDAAFGNGGVGLFSTLEVVETIEISLYLIGVSATFAPARNSAPGCAPRRWAPRPCTAHSYVSPRPARKRRRRSQRRRLRELRLADRDRGSRALEALGIGYGEQSTSRAGSTSTPATRSPAASEPRSATPSPRRPREVGGRLRAPARRDWVEARRER